jgi:hypothetical protein
MESVTISYLDDNRRYRNHSRVEAGSNTSTVALRVVGGDEKRTYCLCGICRVADKSLAFSISYFPICSTAKIIFLC